MFGSVRELGNGRVEVRFERQLRHPPERVWQALTDVDELRAWFVEILDYDRCRLDFTPGARLEFVARGDLPTGQGQVTACEPPRLLEYTWDGETLRFALTPSGDGCLLVFTNTLPDQSTAAAVDPGWQEGLVRLAQVLDARALR